MDPKKFFISPVPPLHKGKNFLCYRDVNRAIEKHREMFGLRLALKRAVKLENYHLTVDQMKDLNLRLKYGELDYHCFAATGRPGRPGNDERCPQLVRLKLSPDAQSLVVYESHNHNILPSHESLAKTFQPLKQKKEVITLAPDQPTCLKGDITLTPINPILKNPVLILPKPAQATKGQVTTSSTPCPPGNFIIDSTNSFTSIIPLSQSSALSAPSSDSEMNSVTITPTPPIPFYSQIKENSQNIEKNEKLTMKIKKSELDPNEMFVVGGVQEIHQQQRLNRNDDHLIVKDSETQKGDQIESTMKEVSKPPQTMQTTKSCIAPTTSQPVFVTTTTPKTGNHPKVVNSKLRMGQKVNQSGTSGTSDGGKSVGGASKPGSVAFHKVVSTDSNSSIKFPINVSQKPLNISQKPNIFPKPVTVATKPTVLRQSPNMKQIIIKKSPQIGIGKAGTAKPVQAVKPLGDKNPNVPNQVNKKSAPKPVSNTKLTNSKASPNVSRILPQTFHSTNKPVDKVRLKNGERPIINASDKQVAKSVETSTVAKHSSGNSNTVGGNSGTPGVTSGGRLLSNPKKLKKKPGRPPDSSTYSIPVSLDTELGFGEKQHLAHGVLFQLLRVTSQLPMVEFSHALDTLEVLTDAFRLGQRVTLSIRRDQEELSHDDGYIDDLVERRVKSEDKEFGGNTAVTTDNDAQALYASQVDGQLDVNDLLKGLASLNSVLSTGDVPREMMMMDVEPPPKEASVAIRLRTEPSTIDGASSSVSPCPSSTLNKGLKRPLRTSYYVGVKRSKY